MGPGSAGLRVYVLPVVVVMSPLIGLLGKSLPERPCATIKATLSRGTQVIERDASDVSVSAERMRPPAGPDLP